MDNKFPKNLRSTDLGDRELRKKWDDQKAEFYYELAQKYKIERCELITKNVRDSKGKQHKVEEPNWDNIVETMEDWGAVPMNRGDIEWAKRQAEHYGIEVPVDEYKAE